MVKARNRAERWAGGRFGCGLTAVVGPGMVAWWVPAGPGRGLSDWSPNTKEVEMVCGRSRMVGLITMLFAVACVQCEPRGCAIDKGVASCIERMRQLGEAERQQAVRGITAGMARVARWELRDEVVVDRFCDIEIRIPDGGRDRVESRLKDLGGRPGLLLATRGYLDCGPPDAGFVTNPEVVDLVCFARMIDADALVVDVQPAEAQRLRLLVRSAFDGTLSTQAFYDRIAGADVSWRQLLWMMTTFARCQEVALPYADVVSCRGAHHGASSVFELCWLAFQQRLGMGWSLVSHAEDRRAFMEQTLVAAYLVIEARDVP